MTKIENKEREKISLEVTNYLNALGVPPTYLGYYYLREAITIVYFDITLMQQITTYLYPTIGKKYDKTTPSIERSIRSIIVKIWELNNPKLKEIFKTVSQEYRPTNGIFIAMLAENLRLKNGVIL